MLKIAYLGARRAAPAVFFALLAWVVPQMWSAAAFAAGVAAGVAAPSLDEPLDEIVITAALRAAPLNEVAQSVTVLGATQLRSAGVQHFADVVGLVPGLSWAAGTSRPRYFQIRGIGEIEQYQGAPNSSVGFLIDDIDFSGLGAPATLFDLDHIEILRGPSGTEYGANALAGLISVRSRDPGTQFDLRSEATGGDFGTGSLGLAIGDGRSDGSAGWRLAAQRYKSDGFRHNSYLGRDATNGYDESTLRGKAVWEPTPALKLTLTLLYADLDDGYDAWSVDNSRVTLSNQPGRDSQRSSGASLRMQYQSGAGQWLAISSAAVSHINYSFDGDWGNDTYWGVNAPYDYFEQHLRQRRTLAQDLRFIGDESQHGFGRLRPIIGVYVSRLSESDAQRDTWNDQYNGAGQSVLDSDYAATNAALYGALEWRGSARDTLRLGLRAEERSADYQDSSDTPFPTARDRMHGGNLSWAHQSNALRSWYATLSRGYKGGGFNIGATIDPSQRRFRAESLWNVEWGLRGSDSGGRFEYQADLYAMRRQSMQVYTSHQLNPKNPLTYVFFTANASHGDNDGVEGELRWQASPRWQYSGSLALQHTRYLGYDLDGLNLDGRAQAFAPGYQSAATLSYQHPEGWFGRFDIQAQGRFYFDAGDNTQAGGRVLCNLRVGQRRGAWTTSFWVRNLLDRRYAVQGYYFGDEPPNFPVKLYLQNGDPRQLGVSVSFELADQSAASR